MQEDVRLKKCELSGSCCSSGIKVCDCRRLIFYDIKIVCTILNISLDET